MMKYISVLVIIALIALSGCAGRQVYRLTDEKFPPNPDIGKIDLYIGKVSRPNIEIAKIDSRCYEKTDDITKERQVGELKQMAAELGADAVDNVQLLSKEIRGMITDVAVPFPAWKPGLHKVYFLRGTAIKFTPGEESTSTQ